MIYLACPYYHKDPAIIKERFEAANVAAAMLMARGEVVFSPISHSHPISISGGMAPALQLDCDFWMRQDLAFLKHCDRLVVLGLDGWDTSKGVKIEMDHAHKMGIPVEFMDLLPASY